MQPQHPGITQNWNQQNPPRALAGPHLWFAHSWKNKKGKSNTSWILKPWSQHASTNYWYSYSCWAVLRTRGGHLEGERLVFPSVATADGAKVTQQKCILFISGITGGFATYHFSPPCQSFAYCVWSRVGSCKQPKPSNSISSSHHSNRPSAGPRNSQTSLSTNKELGFFCLAIRGDKFSP